MTRRPSPWPRRLLIAAVAIFLGAVVFSTWFSHRLMIEVLTGRAFAAPDPAITDPLTLGYRGDPMRAFDLPFEDVTVETPLGPAPAWFVPGAPGARRGAVFVHGIGGAREDGYPYLRAMHEAGLPVLLITYRNDAEAPASGDHLRMLGLTEWEDLDAAMTVLRGRGIEKVVLVAASMGGGIAGQFLARSDQADRVAALVLDAPALDFPMTLRHITDRLGLPLGGLGARLAIPAFALSHGVNLGQAQVLPVVAGFDGPILLFHGANDRIVPPAISFDLLRLRQGSTTFLHTAGDHLQSHRQAPERFSTLLRDFLTALPQ